MIITLEFDYLNYLLYVKKNEECHNQIPIASSAITTGTLLLFESIRSKLLPQVFLKVLYDINTYNMHN